MILFKNQIASEVSRVKQFYPKEELAEKIVKMINEQILPKAINKANLPKFPSPLDLKREEFLVARSGPKVGKPLREKTNFLHDLEKLRYQWNGSELTDSSISTISLETLPKVFPVLPKTELEKKQVEKPFSIDENGKEDISPAPFKPIAEEIEESILIDFDEKVAEKVVNVSSYANLIGRLEARIREKYSSGMNSFSFSIRANDDFPDREKTVITIDLPNTSFKEKMGFWKEIEMYIEEVIEHLNITDYKKKKISRDLYTQIKV